MAQDENLERLTAKVILSNKDIIIKNFMGGIAWGVGSVIGATIIVGTLFWMLKNINWVPVIGNFVSQILQQVSTKSI